MRPAVAAGVVGGQEVVGVLVLWGRGRGRRGRGRGRLFPIQLGNHLLILRRPGWRGRCPSSRVPGGGRGRCPSSRGPGGGRGRAAARGGLAVWRRSGSIRASLLLSSLTRASGPRLLALLAGAGAGPGAGAAAASAGGAGAGGVGGAGGATWVPGPLSCRLDCRPPLLGAWSACPANTIFSETVRSPSLSPSLEMFMMAVLQLLRSLK